MTSRSELTNQRTGDGGLKAGMAEAVLQRCDPVLLDHCGDSEHPDFAEAARMVLYLTDSRRVQKVLWRQLFVLDSMVSLLEGLESVQQLLTQACPTQPEGGARSRWKYLKEQNRSVVEETENLLRSLQDRVQHIHNRRHTLTQVMQQLHNKRQHCEQLEASLLKAQNALQLCDRQLTKLRVESEAVLGQLISWQQVRDGLQVRVSAAQNVMQVELLSINQLELCVALRPRPCSVSSRELDPLMLSIIWSSDDHFRLKVSDSMSGLVESCVCGRRWEVSAALLEVMQCYVGQTELLSEIQTLRSSFAIDWRPAQRLLVYLKSAVIVCHVEVEEGYPHSGQVHLLSVRRDGKPVDTSGLKAHKPLSLTSLLVTLCSSPLI
ncbi:uncharacterized protein si:dkey-225f5.4 isoform X1 [Solea solea]|uniref:uncharacterized protein si:dkey-225f5.4 isoform X1 n=2 Tax=Solea solea TaxID=90069 RepID=UPI00272AC868|nr:uncharacterized protein si:dkey-225f5.4 isoform X1 [Solea solea]